MPTKAEHLALARRELGEAKTRIEHQAILIEVMRRDHQDIRLAEEMLAEFRNVLTLMIDRLLRLEREQPDPENELSAGVKRRARGGGNFDAASLADVSKRTSERN
jgi:t-SNARE complex subunit (syntaxin)